MSDDSHQIDYFDPGHLIGHVKDAEYFEVPTAIAGEVHHGAGHINVPQPIGARARVLRPGSMGMHGN